jgi:predicted ATPase
VLWLLGYPDKALTRSQEALALAQELAHPVTQAYTLWMSIAPLLLRREASAVQKRAEQTIALCREHEIAIILPMATLTRGWALAEQGQAEEGIAAIQQGLTPLRAQGAEMAWTTWQALLAQAYTSGGRIEEGLSAVAEGLRLVERNVERYWEAELYRLRGELLLTDERRTMNDERRTHKASSLPHAAEAEECLQQAIAIARQQHTKSWELRASVSLARLWQQQGKKAEAQQLLSEIYHWFTEGFKTKDLQEAKALLEALH